MSNRLEKNDLSSKLGTYKGDSLIFDPMKLSFLEERNHGIDDRFNAG